MELEEYFRGEIGIWNLRAISTHPWRRNSIATTGSVRGLREFYEDVGIFWFLPRGGREGVLRRGKAYFSTRPRTGA